MLITLLIPALALADPNYPVPGNASRYQTTCSINQMVKEKTGDSWSAWKATQSSESFQRLIWNDAEGIHVLEYRQNQVKYTKITESPKGPEMAERVETVEEWNKNGDQWVMTPYTVQATLLRQRGSALRRTEKRQGYPDLQWEVRSVSSGDGNAIEKSLLNPSALNSDSLKVGSHHESCID